MSPVRWILAYVITGATLVAIDLTWLGVVARGVYRRFLGHLLADQVNWGAALVLYVLLVLGLFVFAVAPGVQRESWSHAMGMGALFGFLTYAIYDLTNLATLKEWPPGIVFIDVSWGIVLCGMVSLTGYHVVRWIGYS